MIRLGLRTCNWLPRRDSEISLLLEFRLRSYHTTRRQSSQHRVFANEHLKLLRKDSLRVDTTAFKAGFLRMGGHSFRKGVAQTALDRSQGRTNSSAGPLTPWSDYKHAEENIIRLSQKLLSPTPCSLPSSASNAATLRQASSPTRHLSSLLHWNLSCSRLVRGTSS